MNNFTPFSAMAGGALIGISVSLMLLYNGRITGISGMMNGLVEAPKYDKSWRLLFCFGLILGGFLFNSFVPHFNLIRQNYSVSLLSIGGILVGFGAKMANGCISGHGICGIARLSSRSIVATSIFMATGIITVYITRHIFGITQ